MFSSDDRKQRISGIMRKLSGREEGPDYSIDAEMAAEEVLAAIEAKSASQLVEAMKSLIEICKGHEESEGPKIEIEL